MNSNNGILIANDILESNSIDLSDAFESHTSFYDYFASLQEQFNFISRESHLFSKEEISFPREDFLLSEFSSTLLIPDKYFACFQKKILQHKGIRSYVAYLLSKYKLHIANGLIPGYANVTTKYQEKGQNLHKVAFRPNPADWAELKLYRVAFGMSISAFLIYLVIADSVDFAMAVSSHLEAVGISSVPEFDLTAKVYLWNQRSDYTIIFQYQNSYY